MAKNMNNDESTRQEISKGERPHVKILFMGRKKVSADCLQWLAGQQGIDIVGVLTDNHLAVSPTSDMAKKLDIPIYDWDVVREKLRDQSLRYDLGVSMLYWRRLSGIFLEIPRYGNINFHPAPLPRYKGVGGYNLAILNKLSTWEVTAHYMDESIDTGPIISRLSVPVDTETETASSLERKSQVALYELLKNTMKSVLLKPDHVPTTPNNGGEYLSRRELEELKRIDFEKDDVDRKIRAFWFPPYDGAYMEVSGVKYTLVNRHILNELADPNVSSVFSPPHKKGG